MAEFKEILLLVLQIGLAPVAILWIVWKVGPKLASLVDRLYDLIEGFVLSMQKVNESNAEAIEQLKSASTQSGSNHGITHGELHSTKATLRHSVNAAIAYVDSIDDANMRNNVKPHLEKAKAEAEK